MKGVLLFTSRGAGVVLLVATAVGVTGCGGDPRDAFEGAYSGNYVVTVSDSSTIGSGEDVTLSKVGPSREVLVSGCFNAPPVLTVLTASVDGNTLTFDNQSSSLPTPGDDSTQVVASGTGVLGVRPCDPLGDPGRCLRFTVGWSYVPPAGAITSLTVKFTGSKQ